MKKLPREEIIRIANEITANSAVIAQHGTSIGNAQSITETGFRFHRTSMVYNKSKNIVAMCSYGWKENPPGDSANVIITIPASFMKTLYCMTEKEYQETFANLNDIAGESLIAIFCEEKYEEGKIFETSSTTSKFDTLRIQAPPVIHRVLPREFIKGYFVFCDNTIYLNFVNNPTDAMDHLTYVENPYYYDRLSPEEQAQFVEHYREKLGKSNKSSRH